MLMETQYRHRMCTISMHGNAVSAYAARNISLGRHAASGRVHQHQHHTELPLQSTGTSEGGLTALDKAPSAGLTPVTTCAT